MAQQCYKITKNNSQAGIFELLSCQRIKGEGRTGTTCCGSDRRLPFCQGTHISVLCNVLPLCSCWGCGAVRLKAPNSAERREQLFLRFQEQKTAPKRKFSGRHHPDIVRAHVPGQKLRAGPPNLGQTSIWMRTSMARTCGRPWPQWGGTKTSGRKRLGWVFVP